MTAAVDAFLASGGVVELARGAVAGSDAQADAASAAARSLASAGLDAESRTVLIGDSWPAAQMEQALTEPRTGLLMAAVGGDHGTLAAPDGSSLQASDVATELSRSAAFLTASHSGLNVPGQAGPRAVDWPELWVRAGGVLVAPSSYAYAVAEETQYAEKLAAHLLDSVVAGDGRVIGDALVAAKQSYQADVVRNSPFHAVTLAGAMLYGLPLTRLDVRTVARDSGDPEPTTAWGAEASAAAAGYPGRAITDSRAFGGLHELTVRQAIPPLTQVRFDLGRYEHFGDTQPLVEAGLAVQPLLRVELGELPAGAAALPARGIMWLGGEAAGEPAEGPVVPLARVTAPYVASPGPATQAFRSWQPAGAPGDVLVGGQWARAFYLPVWLDVAAQRHRRWATILTAEFYSGESDGSPPVMGGLKVSGPPTAADATIRVTDPAGIHRVVAVVELTADRFVAVELYPREADTWGAPLPEGAALVAVQAADAGGEVAVVTPYDGALIAERKASAAPSNCAASFVRPSAHASSTADSSQSASSNRESTARWMARLSASRRHADRKSPRARATLPNPSSA
jgi:hypothetical protein